MATPNRSKITTQLDSLEERLPGLPRLVFRLNRAVLSLGCGLVNRASRSVERSGDAVASTAETSMKTVTGQARSAVDRTLSTAGAATREVKGQAEAQADRVIDEVVSEAERLTEQATTVTDDLETGSYASWTRAELYQRAQELDLDGRSGMNKAQLVDAIAEAADTSSTDTLTDD